MDGNAIAPARLKIVHLAKFTMVDPGLNGAMLERRDDVDVFEETDGAKIAAVLAWVEAAKPAPGPASLDARWGLIFLGTEGERVREIYVDANGTYGTIGNEAVTFASDSLIVHLRATYGEDFVLT